MRGIGSFLRDKLQGQTAHPLVGKTIQVGHQSWQG